MLYLHRIAFAALLLPALGCVPTWHLPYITPANAQTDQVSSQLFEGAPPTVAKSPVPAAQDSICVRVDFVGKELVAANKEIGMRPLFATIQSPTPELFHVDTRVVYITDGFVKQLPSKEELAAVLSYELGRMVAEREAKARRDLRFEASRPPITLPIGDPSPSAADMASTVEMAKYDKARRELQQPAPKLNPESLARNYLKGAGYSVTDFDRVQPLLQVAERNSTLERQIRGLPAPNAWQK